MQTPGRTQRMERIVFLSVSRLSLHFLWGLEGVGGFSSRSLVGLLGADPAVVASDPSFY